MAKIFVLDPDGNTRVPFLRGILTRSLQNSGLPFEEAYKVAAAIRRELGETAVLTSDELREKVLALLKRNYGPRVAARYQQQTVVVTPIQVKHPDGRITPFSGEQHRRCLETIGLTYEEAAEVMARIRQHFLDKHITEISSQHVAHLTYRCLHQTPELGPAVAHRWMIWIDFLRSGRPLVLLIGGTSGCGKSTIATALANRLEIVRMQSTDMLREVMRTMISSRLLPILHTSSFSAWSVLGASERNLEQDEDQLLAEGFRAQVDLLSAASEAVIERTLRERVWLILEGVHVHPSILEKIPQDTDAVIAPIMLAVLKRRELRDRIRGRGTKVPQRRSKRYLEHFDAIWRLQSYLLSEADRAGIPIIVNNEREKVVREIMRTVIDTLAETSTATPATVFL
ncbi:MAG: AAA family ATPase [Gammaproteobacteria bacterium]